MRKTIKRFNEIRKKLLRMSMPIQCPSEITDLFDDVLSNSIVKKNSEFGEVVAE